MSPTATSMPLLSIGAAKKFGRAREFGFAVMGEANFGEEFTAIVFQEFGGAIFGSTHFGEILQLSGIYQHRYSGTSRKTYRLKYYRPKPATSSAASANRAKFGDAVAAYQSLTDAQKLVYHRMAIGRHKTGYNLKIAEFMSS